MGTPSLDMWKGCDSGGTYCTISRLSGTWIPSIYAVGQEILYDAYIILTTFLAASPFWGLDPIHATAH